MNYMQSDAYKILADLNDIDLHFVYVRVKSISDYWPTAPLKTKEEKISIILNQLSIFTNSTNPLEHVINILALRDAAKEYQKHTNWIVAENNQLCVYLWLYVIKFIPKHLRDEGSSGRQIKTEETIQPYSLLEMPLGPTNTSECLQWFHDYFYVLLSNSSLKIEFLDNMRLYWEKTFSFKHKMLKVLQKNESDEEVTSWFWNYMEFSDLSCPNRFDFNSFTDACFG